MKKMIKGACYYDRWFVPKFIAERLFDLAAYDRLPLWQLFFTRRSLAMVAKCLWWRYSLWTADRLPWFARKIAINTLIGREVLRNFMPLHYEHPYFDLCIKW